MVAVVVVALAGCAPQWCHCVLSPRMDDQIEANPTEFIEETGAGRFRLYLSCPI